MNSENCELFIMRNLHRSTLLLVACSTVSASFQGCRLRDNILRSHHISAQKMSLGKNWIMSVLPFDEQSFEVDRLLKDARAMNTMRETANVEYSKLSTPWKWNIRRAIWDHFEATDIACYPRPVHHRIPNFVGADIAANGLATLPEFINAQVVKVNPDTPQRQVRHLVLQQGKTLLTPQPR